MAWKDRWISHCVVLFIVFHTTWTEERDKRQIVFTDSEPRSGGKCRTARGDEGSCRQLSFCPVFASAETLQPSDLCTLDDSSTGICCPVISSSTTSTGVLQHVRKKVTIRPFSTNELDQGSTKGSTLVDDSIKFEDTLLQNNIVIQQGTSSFGHFLFFQSTRTAKDLANQALRVIEASRQLKQQFSLSAEESGFGLTQHSTSNTVLKDTCPSQPQCLPSKYRTIDGSCNNAKYPALGRSLTVLQRILPPECADGIWSPRRARDGSELPSPRFISSSMVSDVNIPRNDWTLMVMLFGQFIDHDLDLVPIFVFQNGTGIECCTPNGDFLRGNDRHPQCFPIEIPVNDPFYGPLRRHCMNFVRSMPGPRPDCSFGYAEQQNELTHFIDGSQIYGSSIESLQKLRAFRGGRLRTLIVNGRETLPLDPEPDSICRDSCFMAGDVRVREQPLLTAMHVIWLREHNRIADQLAVLNPSWDDETLFQESRRIVIAELQHIIYNEFLPILLGPAYMETFGLLTPTQGYYNGYDEEVNPSINNEFAAAAFRMGHSLVQGFVRLFNVDDRENDHSFTISSMFNDASKLRILGHLDELLRGLVNQPIQNMDNSVSQELTRKLFRGKNIFGLDLASLNLQRGRDHCLPGYNSYREVCGLGRAKTFEEFYPQLSPQVIEGLKRVYRSVDDVDLWVAGISEKHLANALLGPTFTCIIGDQFTRLKKGDRFFYDLGNQPHSFNLDQLSQIRKASLARIICDNSDGSIQFIQPLVMNTARGPNVKVPCNSRAIPFVDLNYWIGEPAFKTK